MTLFGKWVDWCNHNFLTHLFKEGYHYHSLNTYLSAISSVHEKADGHEVGQHLLVSRLDKRVFNQWPPRPCYEVIWNVSKVLNYIDVLWESEFRILQILTWKLAMILALTRPFRSADLVMLDLRYCRHNLEGVVFQEAGLENSPAKSTVFLSGFP